MSFVPNVTLDTNCLIGLEEARGYADDIRALTKLHSEGRICLRISASIGGERQKDGREYLHDLGEVEKRMRSVGLTAIILPSPARAGGYANYMIVGFEDLPQQVSATLFPGISAYPEGVEDSAWYNKQADVDAFCAHVLNDGEDGYFISDDLNFHAAEKRQALEELGKCRILRPLGAAEAILQDSNLEHLKP